MVWSVFVLSAIRCGVELEKSIIWCAYGTSVGTCKGWIYAIISIGVSCKMRLGIRRISAVRSNAERLRWLDSPGIFRYINWYSFQFRRLPVEIGRRIMRFCIHQPITHFLILFIYFILHVADDINIQRLEPLRLRL